MKKRILAKLVASLSGFSLCFFGLTLLTAQAISPLEKTELKRLDPQTRLEQRCDIEAMEQIARQTRFSPDKAIAYAFSDPKILKNRIIANGAAFRARGKWYRLSYDCQSSSDAMTILSFRYKLGDMIPRSSWARHYLVP